MFVLGIIHAYGADGNIIKMSNGPRANPTSLVTDGDAGTQDPLLKPSIPQSEENSNENFDENGNWVLPKVEQEEHYSYTGEDAETATRPATEREAPEQEIARLTITNPLGFLPRGL